MQCLGAQLAILTILSTYSYCQEHFHFHYDDWKRYWLIRPIQDPKEDEIRRAAYKRNTEEIQPTIDPFIQQLDSAVIKLGYNMFAATTEDEWKELDQPFGPPDDDDWGEKPQRDDEDPDWDAHQSDWVFSNIHVNSNWSSIKKESFKNIQGLTLPKQLDWRRRLVLPNYETMCCLVDCRYGTYAWAVAVTFLAHLNIKNLLERGKPSIHYPTVYSIQQLLDCLGTDDVSFKDKITCQNRELGGNGRPNAVVRAYKHAILNGLMSDVDYKYLRGNGSTCKFDSKKVNKNYNPFDGYVQVDKNDEVGLVAALSLYGPITVSINANMKYYWLYENGILVPYKCQPGKTVSMVLVGYGEERGHKYWLLMNPWGERWGRDGMLKMQWFGEKQYCNIAVQALFPTWKGRPKPTEYNFTYWNNIEKERQPYVSQIYSKWDLSEVSIYEANTPNPYSDSPDEEEPSYAE